MRRCSSICLPLLATLITFSTSGSTFAQTSVGFADPDDLGALLDYRLPTWSYRTWDAGFDLNGIASDARNAGHGSYGNRMRSTLSTVYNHTWESEQRHAAVAADLDGRYARAHQGTETTELRKRDLRGSYRLNASLERYLGAGAFFFSGRGGSARTYSESRNERREGDIWDENNRFQRTSSHDVWLGAGWGRVRNVVPLLRAQRISERLVALGREPLAPEQIRQMAQVLARETGYREVFDRSNRHFWQDVLGPFLPADAPLNPYEVYYLADVLNEILGTRRQGVALRAEYGYQERRNDNGSLDSMSRSRSPELSLEAYRNLSLHHQLSAEVAYAYSWDAAGSQTRENGTLRANLAHLWNVADRSRLSSSVHYTLANDLESGARYQVVVWNVAYSFMIEDRTSIVASTGGQYRWSRSPADDENLAWDWNYRLGLRYHLDRVVF